ncbi:hypothetical protein BIY24_14600 [Halobacteriovorax marinus]|uniref:DUF2288 domain-containing protein n=1 Tax=Halobacteriovorax marinus TaxID=97084 RepID=UPI000BC34828|nr:DUF2288 domain-containing protein [Halobacteriovorax marinus]ATH09128.1 hypothetical protein BIY24_14600 [Halobacteriovorax marinus]
MENLKEKLTNEIEKATWPLLEEHHKREALLIVDLELDLVDVSVAVANDDVQNVKAWLTSEKLIRPTDEMIQSWEENPELGFKFLIIQPYVIAQEIKE